MEQDDGGAKPAPSQMKAPIEVPRRPVAVDAADDVFTPTQWTLLMSLLDTAIPSITAEISKEGKEDAQRLCVDNEAYDKCTRSLRARLPPSTDPAIISTYLVESIASIPDVQPLIRQMFTFNVSPEQLKGFRFVLSGLNTTAGSLLLTGSMTPFHLQTPAVRQQILLGWSQSYLAMLRGLFRSVTGLAKQMWVWTSPTLPKMIGFPEVPRHGERGEDVPYQFLDFSSSSTEEADSSSPTTIETDVLIVGSGCGAGVCAKNVAEAGLRVVIAEKGHYFPSSHFPMESRDGAFHLMENNGAIISDDGSTTIFAGSTFGGGGTVNWSASLQPQEFVRQEWATAGRLPFFTSNEFQRCLDRVCGYIGATTSGIKHNFANRTLLEGSRRLGYHAKDVPQNTSGKQHYCGHCTLGCASGAKNGPAACMFPAAVAHGAQLIEGLDVRTIEFEKIKGVKRAVGARGIWTHKRTGEQREVHIKASKIIISAGTLNSPLLLMRSGVHNRHLGQNLHLHPAALVGARFDEIVNPWEGKHHFLFLLQLCLLG